MGRSRSRDRRGKEKENKDNKEKDKERKRSRSRERRDRDERKEKKEKKRSRSREKERKEKAPEPEPPRQRSPSFQYRRWRFDSPPKEEEYARDALLTGNAMGLGGVAAALQGGLALGGSSGALGLAADTKAMRELYVGNLPAGITAQQLSQFLNQVAQAVKVNTLPGEPVLSATLGGGGLFAFVEFRTADEAANGLRLNGVELLGSQLKVGRPKGYTGPDSAGGGMLSLTGLGPGGGQGLAGLQTGGSQLALPAATPAALPDISKPGAVQLTGPGGAAVSTIDHRLCLVNIPTFVSEDRIRELLITFGQLKFFALQKDEDQKSVGVAFFEYTDMMTQQQARAALEGLELGAKKLSVKKPDEVIEMGLVAKIQKLGHRVVPSKVLYLKNVVTVDDLKDDTAYMETCTDIRLEAEKFGAVVSMEVPRPGQAGGAGEAGGPHNALTGGSAAGPLALEDGAAGAVAKARPQAPVVPDLSMAIVPVGQKDSKAQPLVLHGGGSAGGGAAGGGGFDEEGGVGYAYIEFATIEGSSKAKKALNGRRFGGNLVEAEYFSEEKYQMKQFSKPMPNTEEPKVVAGFELALLPGSGGAGTLDDAPVMVE